MADLERLRRRAPDNPIYQRLLDDGRIATARWFLAAEMAVPLALAGVAVGFIGALLFAVMQSFGARLPARPSQLLTFGLVNLAMADLAGYVTWRIMRGHPEFRGGTHRRFRPLLWIVLTHMWTWSRWNMAAEFSGVAADCSITLKLNRQGRAWIEARWQVPPEATGLPSARGFDGRWQRDGAGGLALQFGEATMVLRGDDEGWRFVSGPEAIRFALESRLPLDQLVLSPLRVP